MNRCITSLLTVVACGIFSTAATAQLPPASDGNSFQIQNPQGGQSPYSYSPSLTPSVFSKDLPVPMGQTAPNDSFTIISDSNAALKFDFELNGLDKSAGSDSSAIEPAFHSAPLPADPLAAVQGDSFAANSSDMPGAESHAPMILFDAPVITGRPADQVPVMLIIVGLSIAVLSLAGYLLRKVPPPPMPARPKGPFDFLPDKPSSQGGLLDMWPKK